MKKLFSKSRSKTNNYNKYTLVLKAHMELLLLHARLVNFELLSLTLGCDNLSFRFSLEGG